eukprot:scaffold16305_cov124-Isochrysis_galbana.AAC.10
MMLRARSVCWAFTAILMAGLPHASNRESMILTSESARSPSNQCNSYPMCTPPARWKRVRSTTVCVDFVSAARE